MGQDGDVFEETDVLAPKLDCAGLGSRGGHRIFAWSQQKKEGNGE
jgi:hypothetical protein